jgi:hypothetical protein
MAAYNTAVTGHPLRMPYAAHEEAYAANPMFLWQAPVPAPEYRHSVMALWHGGYVRDLFAEHSTARGFVRLNAQKALRLVVFYLGPWLFLALLAVWFARPSRWVRLAGLGLALLLLGISQVFCFTPHYAAPGAALLAVLVVAGLRQCYALREGGRHLGRLLVTAVVLGYPLAVVLSALTDPGTPPDATHMQRADVRRQLEADGRRHLVVVRYHNPWPNGYGHEDWVFNGADIDASRVVWAREIDPAADRRLLDYFADRQAWLLEVQVDEGTYRLTPHPLRESRPCKSMR